MSKKSYTRPALDVAIEAWQQCLRNHSLSDDILWVFAENVCIERTNAAQGSFHVGYQTKFSPPDTDSLEIAYYQFCETNARIVFYRLGTAEDKSVCMLLCDSWFEGKTGLDGYEQHDDWNISFRPGHAGEIEEITDLARWVRRVRHDRAFHDFDFGMALETVDEIRLHGRPLMPYERMAQKMLDRLRRIIGPTS